MTDGNLDNIVLALLFSADEPLTLRRMSSLLDDTPTADIKDALERWRSRFHDEAWSIIVERVAGGYQLSSRSDYAPYIARLYSGRRKLRLSKAALETLAIIAYKQPITRAEVEAIRGVGCGGVLGNLLERSLVRITGKAKVLGAPFLYGTTQEFLEYLGLNSLKDLPSLEDLEAQLEREEAVASDAPPAESTAEVASEAEGSKDAEPAVEPAGDGGAGRGSARLGPGVDEPYHRPLGDDEGEPLWPDPQQPAKERSVEGEAPEEPDDDTGRDEGPSHEPKE